jgi:DNA mismatch endonuclease (patch repair protein)
MSRNPRRDTRPELALRRQLHARGLRFRVDLPLRLEDLTVRPDVVFTRWRIAIFVDGCFWHGCPEHGNTPARNRDYWVPKLRRNATRDLRIDAALNAAGWHVIRAWEHANPSQVAALVEEALGDAGYPGRQLHAMGSSDTPLKPMIRAADIVPAVPSLRRY